MRIVYLFILISCLPILHQCKNQRKEQPKQLTKIDSLSDVIKESPNKPALYYERAQLYFSNQQINYAIQDVLKAIQLDSINPQYYCTLADYYLVANKPTLVRDAIEKCINYNPKYIDAYLKLAELYLFVKNHSKSLFYIEKALDIAQKNPRAYFIKGFNEKETGDTVGAILSYLTATEYNPDYYEAYIQLGLLHKNSPLAISYYNNALKIRPQSVEALYNIAMFYQENGQLQQAIETYKNILQIDHRADKNVYHNLGYIYLFLKNNLVIKLENIDTFKNKIAKQDSLKKDIYIAIDYFTQAIKTDSACSGGRPSYAEAYYHRGLSYELLQDNNNAKNNYTIALQIKPDYKLAILGMERVE